MGSKHIRINTKERNAAVRTSSKEPPFSEEMKRNSAISFDSRKFTQDDIHGSESQNIAGGGSLSSLKKKAHAGGNTGNTDSTAANKGGKDAGKKQGKAGAKKGKASGKAQTVKNKAQSAKAVKGFKSVGRVADRALNQFNEEARSERKDNLGLRTMDESANALIRTKRAVTGTIKTTKTVANVTQKTAQATYKVAKKTVQVAKKVGEVAVRVAQKMAAGIAKIVSFLAANPIVLAVILAVLVLIVLIFMLVSAFQSTPKNLMGEELYSAIQTYLREQDRAVQLEFEKYEDKPEFSDIAEDDVTKVMEVYPSTSMKLMSSYLMAKYENGLTLELAQQEIDAIHSQLYRIEHEVTTEEYEVEEPVLDEMGQQVMNADGSPMMQTVTKTKRLLTVTLTGQTLQQFFDENLDSMLTKSQRNSYDWFIYVSGLFGSGSFGPPFEDVNYMGHVTQEFGQPGAYDGLPHRGMDFSYPTGTPILNIMGGTVVEVTNHWSWGLNVVVAGEDGTYRVRYAHMSAVHVGVGDTVAVGDVVGLVGSTGVSSGPHLHLEVEENGQLINPRDVLPVD